VPTKGATRGERSKTKSTKRSRATKAAKSAAEKAPKATKVSRNGEEWFEVRSSKIQGRGGFAVRKIPAGTRIVEYRGERIKPEVGWERYDDDSMERHHTFLFTLDDDTLVDAGVRGNNARFINHSCEPNCSTIIEDDHIYIEAIEDIPKGAELTYDYKLTREGRYQKSWDALYFCKCGAKNCRGTMLLRRRRKKPSP